ncbi:arginine N-succinyltransferase [Aliidiomarina halalkaliphila]|uniref:Arginine N-succinyltransferase n=1 Tax=Aliidiomarina halalkaliphila TaxID=2593535 RepID=A0A552X0B2_9GAMM|nr:arginine N-succinyltransferase [Aliidiomarina halalkaliphila]TRW48498.1 arginine N-succinyltransferase [Aliidiomarina halalkaliphila]
MLVVRPIEARDYEALYACAVESGHGFTSLPVDETLLKRRISRAEEAFALTTVEQPGEEGYLFVMEDTDTQEIVGVSAIEAAVGLSSAFYHYHVGRVVHHSAKHNVYNNLQTLTLCNDYTGVSELCTLFLREPYRKGRNGRVLSKFRLLFMAQFRQRFADTVIAEMRGISDEDGRSPFWAWLEKHFFTMDFPSADYLTGIGEKTFIAELMPKFPIYVNLLDKSAQEVVGKVHQNTVPALKLLTSEGFRFRGYIDIFDAGPTVEAEIKQLRTVRNSRLMKVRVGRPEVAENVLLCNTKLKDFRACQADVTCNGDDVIMTEETAQALGVAAGDHVRLAAL